MFYVELVERQSAAVQANHAPAGTIDLIVAYLTDKEAIEVAVVQAKHLPEVSKNGTIEFQNPCAIMPTLCVQDCLILWLNYLLFLMSYSQSALTCNSKQVHKSKQ
jgi:hypothetical protein